MSKNGLSLFMLDEGACANLGTIAPSYPDMASLRVHVQNETGQSIPVKFSLSEQLDDHITISNVRHSPLLSSNNDIGKTQQFNNMRPPSETHDATKTWDINLLHWEHDANEQFFVAPYTTESFTISLAVVRRSAVSDRTLISTKSSWTTEGKEFKGRLLIINCILNEVACFLDIQGTICESWLKPDKDVLDLNRVSVGVWTYSDLAIQNLSSIPTQFSISGDFPANHPNSEQPDICFLDAASNQIVNDLRVSIPAKQTVYLKVGVQPPLHGAYDRWFSLQNARNALDVWYIRIMATVTAEEVAERLYISCGGYLDFGNCYENCFTSRDIMLQNNYPETLTVAFPCDGQHHVSYEVLQDGDDSTAIAGDDANVYYGVVHRNRNLVAEDTLSRRSGATDSLNFTPDVIRPPAAPPRNRLAERVTLRPAQSCYVRIWYMPSRRSRAQTPSRRTAVNDPGYLRPQRMQLIFQLPTGETRNVAACAQVCESVLRLASNEVHLGDCDVLVKYTASVIVMNCSDLPTLVTVSYVSQCVSTATHHFSIGPHDTYALSLDFLPRQVNPSYHKEITFTNLRNPQGQDNVFTLRANCVDRQGISLHALFYKILAPGPTNEVDFGATVANHAVIRSLRVRNESARRLVLRLESEPEVTIFVPGNALTQATWVAQRLLGQNGVRQMASNIRQPPTHYDYDTDQDKMTEVGRNYRTAVSLLDPGSGCDYLPVQCVAPHDQIDVLQRACSWGRELELLDKAGASDDSGGWGRDEMVESEATDGDSNEGGLNWFENLGGEDNWIKLMRGLDRRESGLLQSMPTMFSNDEAELHYIERQLLPSHRLQAAVRDGFLAEADTIAIKAGSEVLVVLSLMLRDNDVRNNTKLRSVEKKLVVRMLEYDEGRLEEARSNGLRVDLSELREMARCRTARELVLTTRACKSVMSVSPLRQLNFGTVHVGEQKDKVFTLVNFSEAPLLYKVDKANGDELNELRLNVGRKSRSVIRPYSSKVVPFIYAPCRLGRFEHHFIVSNLLDESASSEVVVKALVKE